MTRRANATAMALIGVICAVCTGLVTLVYRGRPQLDHLRATIPWGPDGTVSFLRAGDTALPRIVYLHGSPGDATGWAAYLTDPLSGFESVALDRPGFGHTAPNDPEPSLAGQASAVAPLLVERDGHWPIVVGHSFGATIACQVAVDYPDRVRGIVLVSTAIDPALEEPKWYNKVADFAFVPRLLPRNLVQSNQELAPLKGDLIQLQPRLRGLACPVAVVHGEKDWLTPFANVRYLRDHLPDTGWRREFIEPEASHFIIWTRPSLVREAIVDVAEATK